MAEEETYMEMPLVVPKVFYMALLAFGIGFYVIWSALYDAWTDIAVYTISALTIGFGVVGILLYTFLAKERAQEG